MKNPTQLLAHPVSWVVASMLGTSVASASLSQPGFPNSQEDGRRAIQDGQPLATQGQPAPSTLSPLAGTVVAGGEVRFRPRVGALEDVPRSIYTQRAEPGQDQDETLEAEASNPYFLGFAGGQYVPAEGERLDPLLIQAIASQPVDGRDGQHTYGFVMFEGRITEERVQALESLGLRMLGYFPSNSLRVALPHDSVEAVSNLEFVRWVGTARSWQKLHPTMQSVLAEEPEMVDVIVSVFESDLNDDSTRQTSGPAGQLVAPEGGLTPAPPQPLSNGKAWRTNGWQEAALEQLGMQIDKYSERTDAFRGRIAREQLDALVSRDFVQFVEPILEPTRAHDESMPLVHTDWTRASYDGSNLDTVVVGEADTGIDSGHTGLNHFWGWGWDMSGSGTGPWNDGNGHGSHVAGTIFGKADVDRSMDGVAPRLGAAQDLRIFNTKIFNDSGSWGGSAMVDILDRFASDLDDGTMVTPKPHVVNHSWGTVGGPWTGTENDCRELDTDIWALGTMHVFASGNEGSSGGTLRMQPSAKNVFTVGNVVDYYTGSVGMPGQLWSSSSRGPTSDLRWKPNVVAPGRWIESVDAGTSTGYVEYSGTSMAAPHVTGLAAQLMDHFSFLQYRASTLGAVMMASALTNDGAVLSAPSTSGTSHHNTYGAGRIEAARAHNLANQALYFWNVDVTSSSGHFELDFSVGAGATQLSAVMLYHEVPGAAGASSALYNDIDMYIDRAPFSAGGNTGEYFAHQSSRDNAETRMINNPTEADYRIKIYPEDVPSGFLNLARVGVCVVVTYGDLTPDANMTTSVDESYVRPNETVELTANVFNPAHIARAVYLNQSNPGGVLLGAETTLKDGHVADLMNNPYNGDRVLMGNIRSGQSRSVRWESRWSTEGNKTWSVQLDAENVTSQNVSRTVVVDGTAPVGPTNLNSVGHPEGGYSCVNSTTVTWSSATDNLAGIDGYSVLFNQSPNTNAPATTNLAAGSTSFAASLPASPNPYYFHIRPVDRSGNWGTTQHYGPFFISAEGTSNYCTGAPNSVGGGASMLSNGSLSMAANNFQLIATGLPVNQPSLFFFGPATANVSFGNGTRCVGGQIVRLPVVYTQNGTTSYTMDFNTPPVSNFITPGTKWFFQNWYRDPGAGGAFFNLTDGLEVTFCE